MPHISLGFLLFTALSAAVFYTVPKRRRWIVLLVFSIAYYLAAGPALILFLLFVAATTFFGALLAEQKKKGAVPAVLVLNFGLLAVLKYTNFFISNLNRIPGVSIAEMRLLLPLGISFYMFQATGYLLDVHWERTRAEHGFFRYLLFVSFFPQILQGPIGRFDRLSETLYSGADFDPDNLRRAALRIAYGYFKKIVIADNAAAWVNYIFDPSRNTGSRMGIAGVLLYGVQLYMDFSGGIDIAAGIAHLFGIRLDENFRQPYFATSITDFWHRWHITLGTWMKDYLFYPLSLSGRIGRFGKWCRKHLPKQAGRALPIALCNIIVFLAVGVWHGAAWHFILYGLYSGVIIGISGLLAPQYRKWKSALHIDDKSRSWHLFQIFRTFVLISISWFLDRSDTVRQALILLKNSFAGPFFSLGLPFEGNVLKTAVRFGTVLFGCALVFGVSLKKEQGVPVMERLLAKPAALRIALLLFFLLSYGLFGDNTAFGGFMYANF